MAHEVVLFRDRRVTFETGRLSIALGLIAQLRHEWLRERGDGCGLSGLLEHWEGELETWSIGFDAALDDYVTSEAQRLELVRLLDRGRERVSEFGPTIPGDVVNRLLSLSGISRSSGVQTRVIVETIDRFREILAG